MLIVYILSGIIGFTLMYFLFIRPKQLQWGATNQEVKLVLPGDELVKRADFNATRAITIAAPAEKIWRWIIQIGSQRAGWYSIDWIDNGGIKSAETIVPSFQNIEVGQFIPFTRDQKNGMWVKEFQEYQYILWTDKQNHATWLWYLISIQGKTRLITRLKTTYQWRGFWIVYNILVDVGDILMMNQCMKGIKRRSENELMHS
jgi:hypothetical protein